MQAKHLFCKEGVVEQLEGQYRPQGLSRNPSGAYYVKAQLKLLTPYCLAIQLMVKVEVLRKSSLRTFSGENQLASHGSLVSKLYC